MMRSPLLALLLLGVASVCGQTPREAASGFFSNRADQPKPVAELPAHVPAPQGKVTLWADFAHSEKGRVPLYLVNRTGTTQTYASQDSDLYIKLEYKDARGKWVRAQAHLSSWCGNSFYPVKLLPGQFYEMAGYGPKEGKESIVRYESFGNDGLVSNEGTGLISDGDVQDAAKDSIAARSIPLCVRLQLEGGKFRLIREAETEQTRWLKSAAAMRVLMLMERNEAALEWVRELKSELAKVPDSLPVLEARRATEEVLSYQWPTDVDSSTLLKRCIALATSDGAKSAKPGTLEGDPELLWQLLDQMFGTSQPPTLWKPLKSMPIDIAELKPLWAAAVKRLREGPSNVSWFAADVLGNGALSDEIIPTASFAEWLREPNSEMQYVAAFAMARRAQRDQLVEIGKTLKPEGQIIALQALAHGERDESNDRVRPRDPKSRNEVLFWEHCMSTQPLEAASTLWGYCTDNDENHFWVVHGPLRDFLQKEAESAAQPGAHSNLDKEKLAAAVNLLGSWRNENDIPLLQLLLKHPARDQNEVWLVRQAAAEALRKQGVEFSQK